MDGNFINDNKLSLKTKGLLAILVTLPEDFKITIKSIKDFTSDKEGSISSAFNEAISKGYLKKFHLKNERLKYAGIQYILPKKVRDFGGNIEW